MQAMFVSTGRKVLHFCRSIESLLAHICLAVLSKNGDRTRIWTRPPSWRSEYAIVVVEILVLREYAQLSLLAVCC